MTGMEPRPQRWEARVLTLCHRGPLPALVNRQEIMGCESVDMVRFELGTLLQGQMRIAKIESAYNSLIIGNRDLGW